MPADGPSDGRPPSPSSNPARVTLPRRTAPESSSTTRKHLAPPTPAGTTLTSRKSVTGAKNGNLKSPVEPPVNARVATMDRRSGGAPPLVHGKAPVSSSSLSSVSRREPTSTHTPEVAKGTTPELAQQQLDEYRDKLARGSRQELSAKALLLSDTRRTAQESDARGVDSPLKTSLTSTSTESGNTVRGGFTPAPVASTPSYPFPRMAPGSLGASYLQRYLNSSPPSSPPQPFVPGFEPSGIQDRVLSGNSTPASTFTFHPPGANHQAQDSPEFPMPNLYDLSLMLNSEPGLDAWWDTVVQIMRDVYKAERVTLSVPADTTDIENVPWGQRATYNEHLEDELSLGYLAGSSSNMPGSDYRPSEGSVHPDVSKGDDPNRPNLISRHSFTSYEENKEKAQAAAERAASGRPSHMSRSKSYFPTGQNKDSAPQARHEVNQAAMEELDAEQAHRISDWEDTLEDQRRNGRILPTLQALDYEADPLIDHNGVIRVIERGRVVALTRSYPYPETDAPSQHDADQNTAKPAPVETSRRLLKHRTDSAMKLSYILPSSTGARKGTRGQGISSKSKARHPQRVDEEPPRPATPKYEEFEQAPPSPWSQSPAPSPAVRPEPKENPFFTDATVDEDSFNPSPGPADYTGMRPLEAIGVDNAWTVLHVPLGHLPSSKPSNTFNLDATSMENKLNPNAAPVNLNPQVLEDSKRRKQPPIAILSILSPITPYPTTLRHSLGHLSPHLATSFSLARHYSNLEIELAGMRSRRQYTTGLGAVNNDIRPYVSAAEIARQQSVPGSITSPSDYSTVSKSATGSPPGTPGWEHGSLGFIVDRRQAMASPVAMLAGGEGYFSSKHRPVSMRQEISAAGTHKNRANTKDNSPGEKRLPRLVRSQPSEEAIGEESESVRGVKSPDEFPGFSRSVSSRDGPEIAYDAGDELDASKAAESRTDPSRLDDSPKPYAHTRLHSYGADFASTFQSLPPNSTLTSKPPHAPSRTGSMAMMASGMPPPSDRLKGLILDALPAQVFVASPQTGEIVWVNSRFLAYRGLTAAALSVDPFSGIHPEDRDEYLKRWGQAIRTGESFSETIRIRRFDGAYRHFLGRAVAAKDRRGSVKQFLGSYMDIHDRHMAELKAARQEEVEASEAKHRLLANLIPQIIFTATEEDGITFANGQWQSYAGQTFDDCLGLGFMDHVHPEDLAKCKIPTDQLPTPLGRKREDKSRSTDLSGDASPSTQRETRAFGADANLRGVHQALSRNNSSSSSSVYELPTADLNELARKGVIKVATDTNGRLSYTTEVRLRSKTGEYRWHLIRCVEIDTIDFGSGESSYFGSATDINDHKLLEGKLKEAMETKSRFLSNMSHEIRTPLIGISGMVSFLQDTTLTEEQIDFTNTIQTSANSLIMIINDILDLSKVDAGMMQLKFEWFHTRSLIEDVNELVSTMAFAKRLELNYLVEEDVPAWVKGDKIRIRQVLLNVIGNAIKFTTEGEVFSRCKVHVENDEHTRQDEISLEFSVTDTGRGFTQKEAELIFKPFSQIDGSSTRQHGGSGLGLVISRQLVELHGGKMEGTAIPGSGSVFTFTARFSLPTHDHPDIAGSPALSALTPSRRPSPDSLATAVVKTTHPKKLPSRLSGEGESSPARTEIPFLSPTAISAGSSNPSVHSGRSNITDSSSVTSVNTGLARFSEAAKASGQDLSQMKLAIPSGRSSPGRTATPNHPDGQRSPEQFRLPMYSILILCRQNHSREATTAHIEMTLPKDVPHQITPLATVEEAQALIGSEDPVNFTHIVINLDSAEAILDMMDQIARLERLHKTTILILSDSVQRQEVLRLAGEREKQATFFADNMATFIIKPVKPSRFAVIFDPNRMRELSIDHNRSTAQAVVQTQKASYLEIRKRMVNKGYKVLLVEDNDLNQKVLSKYLEKIGVDVEIAANGVECTELVLSKPHKHYSIILCDLQMPQKDGYQACREIRTWETKCNHPHMPIIALSANVMTDVQDKCKAAGFSDYITKPVDFVALSQAMGRFF